MDSSRKQLRELNSERAINWSLQSRVSLRRFASSPLFLGVFGSLVISYITLFLLPFNTWNNFFTPDSEFYLSLLVFGNELVEKAINPAYYWTKSAHIIPEHIFSSLFGWELGIQISQFIKLSVIAISSFLIFYTTRKNLLIALTFVIFIILNGTILTMLGNTYVTATALTTLILVYAILTIFVETFHSRDGRHFFSIICLSGVLASSIFIYPLLTIYIAIILVTYFFWLIISQGATLRYCIKLFSIFSFTSAATFSLNIFITRLVFPNRDWLETVMFYTKNLNASDYSNDRKYSILFGDFSLLVIGIGIVISLYVITHKQSFARNTVGIAISQISLFLCTLFQVQFFDSSALEASFFSSFFWIPSLLITCLYFVEVFPGFSFSQLNSFLCSILILGCFILLRFWSDDSFRNTSFSFVLNAFIVLLIAFLVFFHSKFSLSSMISFNFIVVFIVYLSFAHFQNSRELSSSAVGRIPYFSSGENREPDKAKVHVNLEKTLLSQLGGEKAVVWTPPGSNLVTYAAMHFWGPNSISTRDELSTDEGNYFKVLRPEKLFVYVSNREQQLKFLKSLEISGIHYALETIIQNFETNGDIFYVITYKLHYSTP